MENVNGIQIALLIRDINNKITNDINREFVSTGFTLPQLNVIKELAQENQLMVSELGQRMGLTNSTVSGILDRLEKQKMIERVRSQIDRRVVYVKLTPEGFSQVGRLRDIIDNYFNHLFFGVSEEKLKEIQNGLTTLNKIVSQKIK